MGAHRQGPDAQGCFQEVLIPPQYPDQMAYFTETAEGTILNVKAQPRSSKAGLDGLFADAVKVKIKCAPVDGKANKELAETLADAFGLPKSRVVFKSGETSKQKRILLAGVSPEAVRKVVES